MTEKELMKGREKIRRLVEKAVPFPSGPCAACGRETAMTLYHGERQVFCCSPHYTDPDQADECKGLITDLVLKYGPDNFKDHLREIRDM